MRLILINTLAQSKRYYTAFIICQRCGGRYPAQWVCAFAACKTPVRGWAFTWRGAATIPRRCRGALSR
ncbi:hypothetical protein EMIT053CA3_30202 [Pseudomonas donghuensis]